ncbi:MAG: hypothetical protein ACI4O0_07900 [Candidatus Limivicinus sp.]
MTIYIDSEYRCYASPGEGLTAVETDAFTGRCKAFIEGHRYVPAGQTWTREDGVVFAGEMMAPCRNYSLLAELQALYEEEQARQADMAAALNAIYSGVTE